MIFLNTLKLFDFHKEVRQKTLQRHKDNSNFLDNKKTQILFLLHISESLSESKENQYIDNILKNLNLQKDQVVCLNLSENTIASYHLLIQKFPVSKIIFFGEEALVSDLPRKLELNTLTSFAKVQVLLTYSLSHLNHTLDKDIKIKSWQAIKAICG
ncbi:MAG: hypothetical protein MUE53_00410 [Chitinophagales bacterium]|jgi:hypothetical protein|nr:hypothetical protein [Chitinophagales bacterium]